MDKSLSISFVMPMYNEEENIALAIDKIKSVALDLTNEYEIVITDDASTDNSVDIVNKICETDNNVKLFCLKENTKFGGAFARCFYEASKDVVVYMDSDMPVRIEDIKESFPYIYHSSIVTGYSKVNKGDTFLRKVISKVYNLLVHMLFGLKVKDINSGYKIVRKELIKDLKFLSKSPFIDVELFLHAKKKNGKVQHYPLIFYPRSGGKSYIASLSMIMITFRDMIKVWLNRIFPRKDV
jgi:glycosyltransferase involved in cell wall biosynthesis